MHINRVCVCFFMEALCVSDWKHCGRHGVTSSHSPFDSSVESQWKRKVCLTDRGRWGVWERQKTTKFLRHRQPYVRNPYFIKGSVSISERFLKGFSDVLSKYLIFLLVDLSKSQECLLRHNSTCIIPNYTLFLFLDRPLDYWLVIDEFISQLPSRLPLSQKALHCIPAPNKLHFQSEGGVELHHSGWCTCMWMEPVQWHGWHIAQVATAAQVDAFCPRRVGITVTDDGVALAMRIVVSTAIMVRMLPVLLPPAATPRSTQDLYTFEYIN